MKNLFLIVISIVAIGYPTRNKASELHLPTFQRMGFPITTHQMAVLGATHVEECAVTPTLTFADMPASPLP